MATTTRNISDFLNNEYHNYAMSVIEERALPNVIDGLKPGARKIIHASLAGTTKDGKLYKLLALSGDAMRVSLYAHGDASLNSTIVGLCKSFQDNLNPLESDSQVGSLRDPNSAGAPRYLYVKHSKYMDLLYKTDYDLLDFVFDEGQYVEPMNYLPIIPTVLCKNNIGLAVGYSMHNISYNPIDVIDYCLARLKGTKENIIRPYVKGIKQYNWRLEDGKWQNYGEWSFDVKHDIMYVTDLPADISYEDFEKLLNKFEDASYIKDWKNKSTAGNVSYEIKFMPRVLASLIKTKESERALVNKFKLVKTCPDDLLWLLDENHKLKYFSDRYEVVKYFIEYRLKIYTERKSRLVKILEERYKDNSNLVKFIELVCKGKLKIRNRSKVDIKVDMDGYNLPMPLLATPMSKCTIEERDELLRQNEEIKKELDYIKNTSETQMYINDLEKLRKELFVDFPNDKIQKKVVVDKKKDEKNVVDKVVEKRVKLQDKIKLLKASEAKVLAKLAKAKENKDKEKIKKHKEKIEQIKADIKKHKEKLQKLK